MYETFTMEQRNQSPFLFIIINHNIYIINKLPSSKESEFSVFTTLLTILHMFWNGVDDRTSCNILTSLAIFSFVLMYLHSYISLYFCRTVAVGLYVVCGCRTQALAVTHVILCYSGKGWLRIYTNNFSHFGYHIFEINVYYFYINFVGKVYIWYML